MIFTFCPKKVNILSSAWIAGLSRRQRVIDYGKLRISINLDHIVHNYNFMRSLHQGLIPVVKCEAYGHGLIPVSQALIKAGCATLAVGTIDEAVKLREQGQFQGAILSMLGAYDNTEAEAAWAYDIMPFVCQISQLEMLQRAGLNREGRLSICLKTDTGMSRLGFRETDLPGLERALGRCNRLEPAMLCSHLASADDPEAAPLVMRQAERFNSMLRTMRLAGYQPKACLANSAAMLAYPQLRLDHQRIGIALYGINPFAGTDLEKPGKALKPAMEVRAPILQIQRLAKGARVSYGGTFTCPADMPVGIVAAGYANAYSRSLSNQACMLVRGRRVPVIGRVCMQLTAVDLSGAPEASVQDLAVLLGKQDEERITPQEMAAWWKTIPYELFCLLGLNPRSYIQNNYETV